MELTTALIWTLRIVLPIILFCIYFKFQSSKEEQSFSGGSSSGKNKYSRSKLLAHRKAVSAESVPEEFENLKLKGPDQAPQLFQGSSERGGRSGKGGGKRGREHREDRGSKGEARERRETREKPDKEPKRQELNPKTDETSPAATPAAEGATQVSASQEKMHLESLLNYVAFNRKDQQRTFLLDEEGAPPPPPPKPAVPTGVGAGPDLKPEALDLATTTAEKANLEAQMVLRGAINFKRVDVAKDLYAQLVAANVDISESTFTLMIEASVLVEDLKSSSDFLMKMETSGHSPASELLDKVLDLYSNQKTQREQEKQHKLQQKQEVFEFSAEVLADGPRAKLKSDAPIFVPSFGIPPPPPKPKLGTEAAEGEGAKETETEGNGTAEVEPASADPLQRTKLTAAAKPFEPQHMGSFEMDSGMNMWGIGSGTETAKEYQALGEDYGGKGGKGRGGGGKANDSSKEEEEKGGKTNDYGKGRGGGKAGKSGKGKFSDDHASPAAKKGGEEVKKTWRPKETVSCAEA